MSSSRPEASCSLSPERSPLARAARRRPAHRYDRRRSRVASLDRSRADRAERLCRPSAADRPRHGGRFADRRQPGCRSAAPPQGASLFVADVYGGIARAGSASVDRPSAGLARRRSGRRSSTSASSVRRTGSSSGRSQALRARGIAGRRRRRQRRAGRAAAISGVLSRRGRGDRRRCSRSRASGSGQGERISISPHPAPTWPPHCPAKAMRRYAGPASPHRSPRLAWRWPVRPSASPRGSPGQGPGRPRHRLRQLPRRSPGCARKIIRHFRDEAAKQPSFSFDEGPNGLPN